jgi:imidazoleglycerol-phosphate dehydratase/histidinol-phosphatase
MKYKLIIDNKFFNTNLPLSKGLISGLKSLSEKNFSFEVKNSSEIMKTELGKILYLEEIQLNNLLSSDFDKTFCIALKKIDANTIVVKKNSHVNSFGKAVNVLLTKLRTSVQSRITKETDIKIELSLDGKGSSNIKTGIGFFDHMLEQIARHANINLKIKVNGDLNVDEHHTVEDVGITLGSAISEALGDKRGIKRYGFFVPMDDSVAVCAIDLGGRSYLNFNSKFEREKVGEFPTELTEEFFRGIASGLKANIYIKAKAKNDHHKIESIFKAFAKALNEACRFDERNEGILPSTKGVL